MRYKTSLSENLGMKQVGSSFEVSLQKCFADIVLIASSDFLLSATTAQNLIATELLNCNGQCPTAVYAEYENSWLH